MDMYILKLGMPFKTTDILKWKNYMENPFIIEDVLNSDVKIVTTFEGRKLNHGCFFATKVIEENRNVFFKVTSINVSEAKRAHKLLVAHAEAKYINDEAVINKLD